MAQHDFQIPKTYINNLCGKFNKYDHVDPSLMSNPNIKRGLRNADGTGVVAGLTMVANVHGYVINEGDKAPDDGQLTYRGYNVMDLVKSCLADDRYGFEEVIFLLLFGELPTAQEYEEFLYVLKKSHDLPFRFTEDMIIRGPSRDIMNKMMRCVLALYSYDENPDDTSLQNVVRQCIELISRIPLIAAHSYQVKRHSFDKESLFIHFADEKLSTAENILRTIRPNTQFTRTEARLLDLALILHAEHGGGNNSTFAGNVLASSGTDTYSCMAAAIGSLKGPRHGGANLRVAKMFDDIKANVKDWSNEAQLSDFLRKIIRKEAGDGSGLVYGMGHAIYTKSDPRAVLLKENAKILAQEKGRLEEFELISSVERLTPALFCEEKGLDKTICANVDLYSGFVYDMLGIPRELYTPIFAIARVAGWSAHIIEEHLLGGKIIRPAYKSIARRRDYIPMDQR